MAMEDFKYLQSHIYTPVPQEMKGLRANEKKNNMPKNDNLFVFI